MTIDFSRIRPHHGSLHDGFEELCSQLAACEPPIAGARFVRNAPPDAGMECYWVLPNGDEHAWQAKYFFTVDDAQWRQLDDSVETALEKHPRLVRYVVCLPVDLPDARVEGRKSLRDRWNDRIDKWRKLATDRGMNVSFELWGQHELTTRLAETAHAGRRLYWFGGTVFSPEWFVARMREAVKYAGARYSPELHLELPLYRAFEGLGYTAALCASLHEQFEELRRHWIEVAPRLGRPAVAGVLGGSLAALRERCEALLASVTRYGNIDVSPPVGELRQILRDAGTALHELLSILSRAGLRNEVDAAPRERGRFESEAYYLGQFAQELEEFADYCFEPALELVSRPTLLLVGPGGYGKTHALCDLGDRRIAASEPTILILGQQLAGPDPWQSIIGRLGLNCTRDEFLGALQAAAESAGTRALLLIDAINEAGGIRWRDELPAMLEVLRQYPRLGFAVSCRDVVEEELIREDVGRSGFVRVEHTGFYGRIDEAIDKFSTAYGVTELHVPILSGEFASPLFMKLFFRTRKAHGNSSQPAFNGLAELFDTIVRDLDERLSKREQLNYHPSERRVEKAIVRLATLMLDGRRSAVPSAQALEELRVIHPATDYSASLLARLIDEGILTEDVVGSTGHPERIVRFAYERLGEHSIARVLLLRIRSEMAASQAESPSLRWLLLDEENVGRRGRSGLIAAACGLAPAILERELFEAASWATAWPIFARLYLSSLAIRPPTSVSKAGTRFVEELLGDNGIVAPAEVFAAVLEVAVIPGHPLNARWLHTNLKSRAMPERDAVWSTFLHRHWRREGPIRRLIDWAWPKDCEQRDPASTVDPETIRLAALCLGWFLSTPNRSVRDRATKALISLLHHRLGEVGALVTEMGRVNDPYIVERVFAAAYGCAMRSNDLPGIAALTHLVFETAFSEEPLLDVLTRDYASGCVELALHLGCIREGDLDTNRARPPYTSPPLDHPPNWEELRTAYPEEQFGTLHYALKHSDFFRYILTRPGIGGEDGWTDNLVPPRAQPAPYTDAELEEIQRLLDLVGSHMRAGSPPEDSNIEEDVLIDDVQQEAPPAVVVDEVSTQSETARESVLPRDELGPDYAARWILRRVVELGWTPERFREFDREVNRYDMSRSADKPERMSKKYQWIALREFMGRLLDRRPHRYRHGDSEQYEGAWQLSLRDTDPSLLARGNVGNSNVRPSTWWVPVPDPIASGQGLDDRSWLRSTGSIPDVLSVGTVREPDSNTDWATLSLWATWEEADAAIAARRGEWRRHVGVSIGSWLLPRSRAEELLLALADWDFAGHDFGELDLYEPFLGEYFWASSYQVHRRDAAWNFDGEPTRDNTQAHDPRMGRIWVATTSQRYTAGSGGYDCSLIERVNGNLPSVWLAERLGVHWARRYFRCAADGGEIISFDPAAEFGGPAGLLLRRETLSRFLKDRDLSLILVAVGEKSVRRPTGLDPHDDLRPGRLIFRRLLRDDGDSASLVHARSTFLQRDVADEELPETHG